ncbi:MAG TPA: Gldg family protein, partial [Polyangia bacterium]|nr:Gldg family protein [Polyangia bacterium]
MAIKNTPPPAKTLGASGLWSIVYGLGMLLVFLGERILGTGTGRTAASGLGVLFLLVPLFARLVRSARTSADRAIVERQFQSMYVLGLLAIALYFVQSDVPALLGRKALESNYPKLATALGAVWPALWAAAVFALIPMELAYAPMVRAPRVEHQRVRAAQFSGMGLAFMLTFAFSLAYAASERDKKVDLAYFRTTRPGESTRKIVRSLDQPITVALFFPNGNEVREEADNYFTDLAKESAQLQVVHYDHDIDPVKAKEMGAAANGTIVFARGARKEQLPLQVQMESARAALKTLDREVQQRLLSVVKPNRVTAFTQGHGERTASALSDSDKRPGIRELRNALSDQGHQVRDLGPADGLATDVPKDITLVMIIGPTKPFIAEEIAALQRFLDRGGRLFIALDPEGGIDLHELLAPTGLKVTMTMLANDQVFGRRTHQDIDRANLVTALYSSHPSVTTLSRESRNAPVVLPTAMAVLGPSAGGANNGYAIDFPVHAHAATFADANGNFQPDAGEDRKGWELAAVASKKTDATEQRLFVIGDSDFLTDPVIRFAGNGLLVLDPVRWLIGEESFAGQV